VIRKRLTGIFALVLMWMTVPCEMGTGPLGVAEASLKGKSKKNAWRKRARRHKAQRLQGAKRGNPRRRRARRKRRRDQQLAQLTARARRGEETRANRRTRIGSPAPAKLNRDATGTAQLVSQVQKRLYERLRELDLVAPILRQSTRAGAPQYMKEAGLLGTRADYESAYPSVKLYGAIRVLRDGSAYLDIHAKFQPRAGLSLGPFGELGDHYTKTMLSYIVEADGAPAAFAMTGLGDSVKRAFDKDKGDNRLSPRGEIWERTTEQIWSGVPDAERQELADHFFVEATRLVNTAPLTPAQEQDPSYMSEWGRGARQFALAYQEARRDGRIRFRLHGEYAGLKAEMVK